MTEILATPLVVTLYWTTFLYEFYSNKNFLVYFIEIYLFLVFQ